VLLAIQLDRERAVVAVEIDDVFPDAVLPPKLFSQELFPAKVVPEQDFCSGGIVPQFAASVLQRRDVCQIGV
jgi:hypothetical protein